MDPIDDAFILATDTELLAEHLKLHQRPFHVVLRWMKANGHSGDIFDKRIWEPLMESYRKLYPSGDFSIPPMLSGGVAIRDQMYPVRIPVGFGTFSIDPLKLIEIPQPELELAFRHFPDQGWRAFYGACDALDFAYGVDDLLSGGTPKPDLFANARSNVAATTRILAGDVDVDAAVQSACLSAELALKGGLAHLGLDERALKDLSHNLPRLAAKLVELAPGPSDARLLAAVQKFPNYVGARYAAHGLTRVQLMDLAMRAQYVAADVVRRITDRNFGGEMEARNDTPSRAEP